MKFLLSILLALAVLQGCQQAPSTETKKVAPGKEALLRDSVLRYPDSLLFRENLVQFYRDSGFYDKAIRETTAGIQRDSSNPRLFEMLAILYFEKEDTAHAIQAFEKAVEIAPVPQYMISLGTLYAQTQNPQTLPLMQVLLQEYPKSAKEAWFITGLYKAEMGKFQEAISDFDKCLAISFTFMEAYREKSIALYHLGAYEKSLEVINKAVTLQNNYEEGYYYKGKVLEKLNRNAEAMEAYRTALMYAPDYSEASEALNRLENKN